MFCVLSYHCMVCDMSNFFLLGMVKGKAEHLYSALYGIQTTLKRSDMDHTVLPAINTIPAVLSEYE